MGAALTAAPGQDAPSSTSTHADPKSVRLLSLPVVRLIRLLHVRSAPLESLVRMDCFEWAPAEYSLLPPANRLAKKVVKTPHPSWQCLGTRRYNPPRFKGRRHAPLPSAPGATFPHLWKVPVDNDAHSC